jgi:hypothetical protein
VRKNASYKTRIIIYYYGTSWKFAKTYVPILNRQDFFFWQNILHEAWDILDIAHNHDRRSLFWA